MYILILVFSFRLRLLLDVLSFNDDSNVCYFNTTDMSLIKIRLDDAIMESIEDEECTDQFLLDEIPNIRSSIVKLVSTSLIR